MTTTTPPNFTVGSCAYSQVHGESVRILDVETVWNMKGDSERTA
jgi:hypothetical protein